MSLKTLFWVGACLAIVGFVGLVDQSLNRYGTVFLTTPAVLAVLAGLGMIYASYARQPGSQLPVIITSTRIGAARQLLAEAQKELDDQLKQLQSEEAAYEAWRAQQPNMEGKADAT